MAALVYKVQECWKEKIIAAALFMDVKKAFDHILKGQLIVKISKIGVDKDLIK